MGMLDRLKDFKEDKEVDWTIMKEGKRVQELYKHYKGNDYAINELHMDMDQFNKSALFWFKTDGITAYGQIFCLLNDKEDRRIDPTAQDSFLFEVSLPLPDDAVWPEQLDDRVLDKDGNLISFREVGFATSQRIFFIKESDGKRYTSDWFGKTFHVKKNYPISIADNPDEADQALRDFMTYFDGCMHQFSDVLRPMLE
jgi:hypothetical protein